MEQDPFEEQFKAGVRGVKRGVKKTGRSLFSFTTVKFLLVLFVMGIFGIGFFYYGVKGDATIGITLKNRTGGSVDLERGLVGHWTFDGSDMLTNVNDRGSGDNDGFLTAFTSGTTTASGKVGQALRFVNGNYVNVGDPTDGDLDFGTGSFSYGGWVNTTETVGAFVLNKTAGAGTTGYDLLVAGGSVSGDHYCRIFNGATFAQSIWTSGATNGTWIHLMCVIDRSAQLVRIYGNGVLRATADASAVGSVSNSNKFQIGARADVAAYDGMIDDARVYNRALSAEEVRRLYDVGATTYIAKTFSSGTLDDQLIGHYTFDGKDMYTRVADASGVGNHGRLVSFASTTTVPGVLGQALDFDGSNDYITLGDVNAVDTATTLTVCSWVYHDAISDDDMIVNKRATNSGLLLFRDNVGVGGNDLYSFFVQESAGAGGSSARVESSPNTTLLSTWTHVCGTFLANNANGLNMYINGAKTSTSPVSTVGITDINAGTDALTLGEDLGTTRPFNGKMDDVRIYTRVLPTEEIKRIYDTGATTRVNVTVGSAEDGGGSLTQGLRGHYTFDGKHMYQNVQDVTGNGNTGYLRSFTSTTTVIGKLGQALSFDGVDDYLDGGTASSLEPSLPLTLAGWFKLESLPATAPLIAHRSTTVANYDGYWLAVASTGAVDITFSDNTGSCGAQFRRSKTTSASTVVTGQWYHIVGVIRGATDMSIYVNGVDQGGTYSGTAAGTIAYNSNSFLSLGRGGNGAGSCFAVFADVLMDDVRIYARALSAEEAKRLYDMGR